MTRHEEIDEAIEGIRQAVERQTGRRETGLVGPASGKLPPFGPKLDEPLDDDALAALIERVEAVQPWLQGPFPLPNGLAITGAWRTDSRWEVLAPDLPEIEGRTVLDVGANAGYDAFQFAARGAARVVAAEPFAFIRQARLLQEVYGTSIELLERGWRQLDPAELGTFDIVHCHGVLYHEPHPMELLERLRELTAPGGHAIIGSIMHDDPERAEYIRFVPDAYYGDPTWWFVPGRLAMRWMLEAAGLPVERSFGLAGGPPGEFRTIDGYFRCRRGEQRYDTSV